MSDPSDHYALALGDINDSYLALRPPQRMSVSQGASAAFRIKRPGESATPWSATDTPYMVRPMDSLASRLHEAVIFVGPSQSGKTAGLGEGWISHVVTNDPGDMLVVQMTEGKAREYSKQRIDRMLLASDKLSALQSNSARDDNTHDKGFKHGMWLKIAWPTVTNLSSSSYRYVFLTDFDRMPEDLDGEGDAFALASPRTRTYMSRGMVCAESSPGFALRDPNWVPATKHEAPPCGGILGLYNGSDRERWYWKCPDCRDWFEAAPGLSLFNLPDERELIEEVRTSDLVALAKHHSRVVCPHCGSMIDYKHRYELNRSGIWLPDGQTINVDDEISGTALESSRLGFWLGGVAAAYQSWQGLVNAHLQGLRDYAMTGSEKALQTAVNTGQGAPYMPRHLAEAKGNKSAPSERTEDVERYICPDDTRCVVASVDVQGGVNARFVVQVHAIQPWMEQTLIDRYEIKDSAREGMGAGKAPIDPASFPEDWDVLTARVLRSTYRTSEPGREIRLKMMVVDSGGEDGVTKNAYAWYRRIRKAGLQSRVRLYKGASARGAPEIRETLVGQRSSAEKGDIPLLVCNPNTLSDSVATGLGRTEPGPGYYHFPKWLKKAFFDELGAEVRGPTGVWTQISKRNESFDLCRMIRVGCLSLGLDKIRVWHGAEVPTWLRPLDENTEVITDEQRRAMQDRTASVIAETSPVDPAQPAPVVARRAVRAAVSSPYLGR